MICRATGYIWRYLPDVHTQEDALSSNPEGIFIFEIEQIARNTASSLYNATATLARIVFARSFVAACNEYREVKPSAFGTTSE